MIGFEDEGGFNGVADAVFGGMEAEEGTGASEIFGIG